MSNIIVSPNMGLPVPVPGQEDGPLYASDVNNSLNILDAHTHIPGSGVQITPYAININADLAFNIFNATLVKSLRFSPLSATLSGPSDIGCLYEVTNDLYYNDGVGNQIRLTQGGSIVGAAGTITGLPSGTASASFAAGTFVFQSATNTSAVVDCGSVILRNNTALSKGLTLAPPNAMAANYGITLPSLPSSNNTFLLIDTAGTIGATVNVDSASIEIASNNLRVKALGIQASMIATGSITQVKMGALGQILSVTSGSFTTSSTSYVNITNMSCTIVTTGRPVIIFAQPSQVGSIDITGTTNQQAAFLLNGTTLANPQWLLYVTNGGTNSIVPPSFMFMDTPAAGVQTYTLRARVISATSVTVNNLQLVAYEL